MTRHPVAESLTLSALRQPLAWAAGFSFMVNLLLLVPALFMLQVFDRVLNSGSVETLIVLLLGVAIALLLMMTLDHLRSRLQGVAGQMLGDALSPLVARLTLAARARARPGPDASTEGLRDVAVLRQLFTSQGLLALFDAPWLLVYVAFIALAHPALGAAASVAALLMIGLAIANDRLTRRGIEAVQRQASAGTRYLEGSMVNAEVVQTLGMADALLARWHAMNADLALLQRPIAQRSVAMAALARTLRQAVQVAMLALGAWLVITQRSTPGVMVATTILLGRALAPVEQVVGSWRVLADARASWGRLQTLLAESTGPGVHMPLPVPAGALQAIGLAWHAPGSERMVLAGVSLQLAAGQSLAVIGASGAGKSTLLRLLTGLWVPSAGSVRLDGADVAQWPRGELGPHIGYVPQAVELLAATVGENIARMGSVDSGRVVAAARAAGVHELVLSLPAGYDTRIDPQATLLSPGQRQRIALARALYGEPKLLVLDEPNSNLDAAGEAALAETLQGLRGKATVVVVTHRSTLVQHLDQMLVLAGGRVQHYGSMADVLQALQAAPASGQVVALVRGDRHER